MTVPAGDLIGTGISGRHAKIVCSGRGCRIHVKEVKCPIVVQRFPELPKWVNERTFAIITSYSGNTSETIEMYHNVKKRNCPMVVMTSGGELERLSIENGDKLVKLEPGFQPRSALGAVLGNLTCVIDNLCGTHCSAEIERLMPSLRKLRTKLEKRRGQSRKIAEEIKGRVPIIYATSGINASAIRWKTQINENSKMMAFAGSVPEFNHNEISGWSQGELREKCVLIVLYEDKASKDIRRMADESIEVMKKYKQDVIVVHIEGDTVFERTLRAVMIGDFISLYLADLQDVDPRDVSSIKEFKARFNESYQTYGDSSPKKSE